MYSHRSLELHAGMKADCVAKMKNGKHQSKIAKNSYKYMHIHIILIIIYVCV